LLFSIHVCFFYQSLKCPLGSSLLLLLFLFVLLSRALWLKAYDFQENVLSPLNSRARLLFSATSIDLVLHFLSLSLITWEQGLPIRANQSTYPITDHLIDKSTHSWILKSFKYIKICATQKV
jgi:hypothetical protein